jgi:ferritin-like metal-binding protein YciE
MPARGQQGAAPSHHTSKHANPAFFGRVNPNPPLLSRRDPLAGAERQIFVARVVEATALHANGPATAFRKMPITSGGMKMSVDTIEKLFVEELKDLYSAENQINKALPKMAKAAKSNELRNAFETHLRETEGQIKRLDQVFEILGTNPKGKNGDGIKGVLDEGSHMLDETKEGEVRDVALISAAQRVEHYQMAAYGTVRSYAERLGKSQVVQLLQKTLEEVRAADKKLTDISQQVYLRAQHAA